MNILLNQTDIFGNRWKVVFVWPHPVPLWCHAEDSGGEILCWDGFENAIGWKDQG